jgi:hypothetical protein
MLVLLMLVLGSLTLQGVSVQHQAQVSQTTLEKVATIDSANAESLLEWGRVYAWSLQPVEQCRVNSMFTGRVCLRLFIDGAALLIARSGEQIRWQTGQVSGNNVLFDRNGWSDFCPRKETVQCQIP